MIYLLLGCPAREPSGEPTAATSTEPPPGCAEPGPCGATLAEAVWSEEASWTGYDLEAGLFGQQPVVLVGSPGSASGIAGFSSVAALEVTDLEWIGTFEDDDPEGSVANSDLGTSIAIDPERERFAAGAPDGAQTNQQEGVLFVFERLPSGLELVDPVLKVHGDLHWLANLGTKVLYADLAGEGVELISAAGTAQPGYEGGIYRFDPSLTGEHGLDVARSAITGGYRLGQQMAAVDLDLDGLDELVSIVPQGVAHFDTPWTGDITEEDADVLWSADDPGDQLGEDTKAVGDIDGDGHNDLAIGAQTHWGLLERTGALYIVPAGSLASGPASSLAYQFLGTELGEGLGSSATSGDYDGDGETDLVVGAYGVSPGTQAGKVLGYLGPLTPAIRRPADADFVIHGEGDGDLFGADVVTVDSDGDVLDDLVVGAQGYNSGRGQVYLLLASDFLPANATQR